MIGYDRLGTNGRFGNQLFQYAALRGIAANRGFDWCIPPDEHQTLANYGIHHPFKLTNLKDSNIGFINPNVTPRNCYSFEHLCASNPDTKNVTESSFLFDEELFNNIEDGSNLDGYLQSEKYFKNVEDELREDFEFIDEIVNPCKEFISSVGEVIFLHVRRGDNIGREDYHPVLSFEYYKKALEQFNSDVNVLVCSDDVEWCKEQEFFNEDRFLMNDTVEKYSHQCQEGDGQFRNSLVPYTDLCLMSLCNGAILSPSTLGWWGAWLQKSNDKKIIVPQNWFGPKLSMNDTSDLIPEEWIILDEN
jgi:hypothetical protein